jgi:hypothetical protein
VQEDHSQADRADHFLAIRTRRSLVNQVVNFPARFLVTQIDHSLVGRQARLPGIRTCHFPAGQKANSPMIRIAHLPPDSEEGEDFQEIRTGRSAVVLE